MTIDEAIAHERDKAKEHKDKAEYQLNRGIEAPQINLHLQSETEQAEYHEQLAEWLEELKAYREIATIDEFSEAANLISEILEKENKRMIEIVEQLKGGDAIEQN